MPQNPNDTSRVIAVNNLGAGDSATLNWGWRLPYTVGNAARVTVFLLISIMVSHRLSHLQMEAAVEVVAVEVVGRLLRLRRQRLRRLQQNLHLRQNPRLQLPYLPVRLYLRLLLPRLPVQAQELVPFNWKCLKLRILRVSQTRASSSVVCSLALRIRSFL